jgi:hypothetical protein
LKINDGYLVIITTDNNIAPDGTNDNDNNHNDNEKNNALGKISKNNIEYQQQWQY